MKHRNPIDQIEFMRNLLAFLLVGAFISVLPVFTLFRIPDENKEVITYMIGQLSGMATMALGFYFVNKVGQDALDAKKSDNTGRAFEVLGKALEHGGGDTDDQVEAAVDRTAEAAVDQAKTEKGKKRG